MSSCSRLHRPRCPANKQETTQQRQQSFRHTQLRLRQRPAPGRFVRRVAGGLGGWQAIEAKNELAVLRQAFDATDRQLRAERLDQKRIQARPPARPSPSHPIPSGSILPQAWPRRHAEPAAVAPLQDARQLIAAELRSLDAPEHPPTPDAVARVTGRLSPPPQTASVFAQRMVDVASSLCGRRRRFTCHAHTTPHTPASLLLRRVLSARLPGGVLATRLQPHPRRCALAPRVWSAQLGSCCLSRRHGGASRSGTPAHYPVLRAEAYERQMDNPLHTSGFARSSQVRVASPDRWRSAETMPGGFAHSQAPSPGWPAGGGEAWPSQSEWARPSQTPGGPHASEHTRPAWSGASASSAAHSGLSPAADTRRAPVAGGMAWPHATYASPQPPLRTSYAGSSAALTWATPSGGSLLGAGVFQPGSSSGIARQLEESAFASAVREFSERR
jgi:hypothetical protein